MSEAEGTSDALFELAFRHAAVGMAVVALDGRWLQVNDALCDMFGYTRDEMLGLDFQRLTHPDDLRVDLDHVERLVAGAIDSYVLEKRFVHKSGRVVWGLLSVSLARDSEGRPRFFVSQTQDVSRRHAAESEVQAFFDLSPDLLAISRGEVLDRVNPAWTRVLGWTAAELTSQPFLELVHEDDRERTRAEMARTHAGHAAVGFRNRYRARDGSYRWLAWSSSLSPDGQVYSVARDITEQQQAEEWTRAHDQTQAAELERLASLDALTDLLNRRHFSDLADRELRRRDRYELPLALLVIDADHFKAINDLHGHAAGDQVLRGLGALLTGELRDTDLLCRWGGEEFVALLVGTDRAGAQIAAERIVERCASTDIGHDGDALRVTVSVGVTVCQPEDRDIALVVARADRAMYAAKAAGRNRVQMA